MQNFKHFLLAFCLIVLSACSSSFEKKLHALEPEATTILALKGDSVLYSKGPQETLFSVASITKQFTAFLVLRETTKRQISLDTPINRYVKNLPAWGKTVTLYHLLTHSSGVRTRTESLAFSSGSNKEYSSTVGYGLLADMLASLTGKPYPTLMKELFQEVGMNTSGLRVSTYIHENIKHYPQMLPSLHATKFGGPTELNYQDWHAAGGLITSAQDLSKWWHFLKKDPLFQKMSKAQTKVTVADELVSYGFGLSLSENAIFHIGSNIGYFSILYYFPHSDILLIALSNQNTPKLKKEYTILRKILAK